MLPTPVQTETHHPVPFHVLDDLMQHRLKKEFGADVSVSPQYALNRLGTQFFAVYALDDESGGILPAAALRSSIDKSLSIKAVGAAKVVACTNTCLWGEGNALSVIRKQTKDSLEDIESMLLRLCAGLENQFSEAMIEVDVFKETEVFDRSGGAVLGELYHDGVLQPQQMTRAMTAWKKPAYDEFAPRTAWSLYNAVTEGLKKADVKSAMGRFSRLHDDFNRRFVRTLMRPVISSDDVLER